MLANKPERVRGWCGPLNNLVEEEMDQAVDIQKEVTAEQQEIVELPLATLSVVSGGSGKEGTGLPNSY